MKYNTNKVCGVLLVAALSFLNACSDKNEPAAQQGMVNTAPAAVQQKPLDASALPQGGKVIKAMHAGGYTYMELEEKGQQFWIASTMMNVKRNDHVTWRDAAIMKNFKSSSLHRTFDEILFVSSATVQ